jgi:hypothetical protein
MRASCKSPENRIRGIGLWLQSNKNLHELQTLRKAAAVEHGKSWARANDRARRRNGCTKPSALNTVFGLSSTLARPGGVMQRHNVAATGTPAYWCGEVKYQRSALVRARNRLLLAPSLRRSACSARRRQIRNVYAVVISTIAGTSV